VLRATSHDAAIRSMIEAHGVQDVVALLPSIPYDDALAEMLSAGVLLLFQAENCNHQIPAKLYEYMRSGRPIFALTHARGDTATTLRAAGIDTIADLASASDIEAKLPAFLERVRAGTAPRATVEYASTYSRRSQAQTLASLFTSLAQRTG
jgi:hypothetical protein